MATPVEELVREKAISVSPDENFCLVQDTITDKEHSGVILEVAVLISISPWSVVTV